MTDTAADQTQVPTPKPPRVPRPPAKDVSELTIPELLSSLGVKRPEAINTATLLQMPVMTMAESGLSKSAQRRVATAIELTKRLMSKVPTPSRLDSPELVAAFLSPMYSTLPNEIFGILALDSKHRVLAHKVVAAGGRHSVAITPADIFSAALPFRPRSIVAFHNHPSGDPHPSEEDKALTYRLARAGEVLGIALVDHVVLGSAGSFASFKQLGLL